MSESDFSDVASRDIVRVWPGSDKSGLPVVVLAPCHLGNADRESAFRFFEHEIAALNERPYRIVLIASGRVIGPGLMLWAMRRSRSLPVSVRKGVAAVSVVHPDAFVRSAVWLSRLFVSAKFWEKDIQLADRIEELVLDDVFTADDLQTLLPPICRQFERDFLEVEAEDVRAQARAQGLILGSDRD